MAGSMSCYKLNPWLHKFGETTLTLCKRIETSALLQSSFVKCVSWGTYCLCTNWLDKGLHGWDQPWEEYFCAALLHLCEPGLGKLRWSPQTQVNPTHRKRHIVWHLATLRILILLLIPGISFWEQCLSKCGAQASGVNVTWKLFRSTKFWILLQTC